MLCLNGQTIVEAREERKRYIAKISWKPHDKLAKTILAFFDVKVSRSIFFLLGSFGCFTRWLGH